MPVNVFIQEARNLVRWAADDERSLTSAGMDFGLVGNLPRQVDALGEAEATYQHTIHTKGANTRQLQRLTRECRALFDDVRQILRFACRDDEKILAQLHSWHVQVMYWHSRETSLS